MPSPELAALVVLLALGLTACPARPGDASDSGADAGPCLAGFKSTLTVAAGCAPVGWSTCPLGFEADPAGFGCLDVQPERDCLPGSMPVLGHRECQPVGVLACPKGFEADPSGWGCRAVLPAAACAGATMEVLGQTSCGPIGDCAAPFPPPEATHLVDAAFPDAQLGPTHFRSIGAALDAAPAGAVVAIEAGTYLESLRLTRRVTLAGRCAALVRLEGGGGASPGLTVSANSTVRGLAIRDHLWGALVLGGAQLTLAQSLVEANRGLGLRVEGVGAAGAASSAALVGSVVRGTVRDQGRLGHGVVAAFGGKVSLEGCVVAGNGTAGVSVARASAAGHKSEARVFRSIVRDTQPKADGSLGVGLEVVAGALQVRESVVVGNHNAGVTSVEALADALVEDSCIQQTACSDVQCAEVRALSGGQLTVNRSSVAAGAGDGLLVLMGSQAKVSNSVLRRAGACPPTGLCAGMEALEGSHLDVAASAVVDGVGAGLLVAASNVHLAGSLIRGTTSADGVGRGIQVESQGMLTAEDSALVANQGVGVNVAQGTATMSGLIVRETRTVDGAHSSSGLTAQAAGVFSLARSAVASGAGWGLRVAGRAEVSTCIVRDTGSDASGNFGRGVQVDSGGGLRLSDSLLLGNREAGLLVIGTGSVATLSGCTVRSTQPNGAGLRGYGAAAQAGAELTLDACALLSNRVVGIGAFGQGTRVTATGSLVEGTQKESGDLNGHGVIGTDGASLRLDDSLVRHTDGIGLTFSGSSAAALRSIVEGNAVGLHVQGGSTLTEGTSAPGPLEVVVDPATVFLDNATRLGSGVVPLPELPVP